MGCSAAFCEEEIGSMRMCIHYWELNKVTIKNWYPLSRIDDRFDQLQGSYYFQKLISTPDIIKFG